MKRKVHSDILDSLQVFGWIETIRDPITTEDNRSQATTAFYEALRPISRRHARVTSTLANYDAEQIVNDAIDVFLRDFVEKVDFPLHSCGHIASILAGITRNLRKEEYRRLQSAKRTPRNSDGQLAKIESLDSGPCNCKTRFEDPVRECLYKEEVERCSSLLRQDSHQQVFLLLLSQYTWPEIASKLNADMKTIRLWIDQMRNILTPHTSHLTPQSSILNPQSSILNPQSSILNPQSSKT